MTKRKYAFAALISLNVFMVSAQQKKQTCCIKQPLKDGLIIPVSKAEIAWMIARLDKFFI